MNIIRRGSDQTSKITIPSSAYTESTNESLSVSLIESGTINNTIVEDNGQDDGGIDTSATFVNIIKAYLGTGILAFPYALQKAGFISGIISTIILSYLLNHTMKLIIRIKILIEKEKNDIIINKDIELKEGYNNNDNDNDDENINIIGSCNFELLEEKHNLIIGFSDIGKYCYGTLGILLINFAVLGTNIGISIGYLCILSQNLNDFINTNSEWSNINILGINTSTILWLLLPFLSIICCLKIKTLSFSSYLGNIGVLLTMLFGIYISIKHIINNTKEYFLHLDIQSYKLPIINIIQDPIKLPITIIESTYPLSFGIFLFSFVMHGIIITQYQATKESKRKLMPKILDYAAILVVIIYIIFSSIAYLAFGDQNIGENILITFEKRACNLQWEKIAVKCTNILLSISIFCSIPLFMDEVFSKMKLSFNNSNGISEQFVYYGRTAICTIMIFIVQLVRNDFANILSLVGALTMSWLGCILPCLFYIKLSQLNKLGFNLKTYDGFITIICGICGIAGMITGTWASINAIRQGK